MVRVHLPDASRTKWCLRARLGTNSSLVQSLTASSVAQVIITFLPRAVRAKPIVARLARVEHHPTPLVVLDRDTFDAPTVPAGLRLFRLAHSVTSPFPTPRSARIFPLYSRKVGPRKGFQEPFCGTETAYCRDPRVARRWHGSC